MIDTTLLAVFIPTFLFVSATPGMCMTLAMTMGMTIGVKRTLWAWGANNSGNLGDGTNTNSAVPVKISNSTWTAAAAGDSHSLGIKEDSTLWAWGSNSSGQLGDGSNNASNICQAPTDYIPFF